jgi:hypothetical protein
MPGDGDTRGQQRGARVVAEGEVWPQKQRDTWQEVTVMKDSGQARQTGNADDTAYLEFEIADGRRVITAFPDVNDRDGCEYSLEMHQIYIGPVDEEALLNVLRKFNGRVVGGLE